MRFIPARLLAAMLIWPQVNSIRCFPSIETGGEEIPILQENS